VIVSGIHKSADIQTLCGISVQRIGQKQGVFRLKKEDPLTNALRESHLYSGLLVSG
jgi:hypothetical protein